MICTGSGNGNNYHSLFSINFQLNCFPSPSPISTKKNHHAFYKWFFLTRKLQNSTMDINGGLNWKSPELFLLLRNQIRIKIFSIVSIKSWFCVWESYLRYAQINFRRSNSSIVSSLYYTKLTRNHHMVEVNRDPKKIGF
jgi:hypothetical protein